jgi:hypothetical protein
MSAQMVGQRVRVKLGRFGGCVGTVDSAERDRVRVVFDEPRFIGRHSYSSAWFYPTSLEPIP